MVFYWSLRDSKSPQVSKTLLCILADFNNAVFWMVSSRIFISKSSGPIINPLVTVLSEPITIGITVTFMFHSFFSSLARSRYLSFFSLSFCYTLWTSTLRKIMKPLLYFQRSVKYRYYCSSTRMALALNKPQKLIYYFKKLNNTNFHTPPEGISPKVNVIVPLKFELTYYDIAVEYVSHYTTGSPGTTRWKLFMLDRDTWYHITLYKQKIKYKKKSAI